MSGSAAPSAKRGAGGRTPKQRAGAAAEESACALLVAAGCRIVARNVRYREGELDIVAWDGGTLVFVEVRLRRDARYGGATASVDEFKRRRLVRAARHYLAETHGAQMRAWPPCRFDVVGTTGASQDWLRDAFAAAE